MAAKLITRAYRLGRLTPVAARLLRTPALSDPVENEERVRKGFWPKVKRFARRIPFLEDVIAAYYCAMDPKTPLRVKGTLLAAIAYFVMPVDFIPDIVAGFGFIDDAAVISAVLSSLGKHITPAHHEAAQQALRKLR